LERESWSLYNALEVPGGPYHSALIPGTRAHGSSWGMRMLVNRLRTAELAKIGSELG
jgi:hypothetical protein